MEKVKRTVIERRGLVKITTIIRSMTKVNEDDSLSFLNDKGEEVKVQDGVKAYLDTYPEFRMNP